MKLDLAQLAVHKNEIKKYDFCCTLISVSKPMNVMKQNIILSCLLSLYAFIHCYYTKDVGHFYGHSTYIQIIFVTYQELAYYLTVTQRKVH